jgi:hypothetical protein
MSRVLKDKRLDGLLRLVSDGVIECEDTPLLRLLNKVFLENKKTLLDYKLHIYIHGMVSVY